MSTQEQNTPTNTDSDPRHHVIPDEGWEWKTPLTKKELFDENARLRKRIKELESENLVLKKWKANSKALHEHLESMQSIDPEIQKVVNENFWDMIGDNSESKHP